MKTTHTTTTHRNTPLPAAAASFPATRLRLASRLASRLAPAFALALALALPARAAAPLTGAQITAATASSSSSTTAATNARVITKPAAKPGAIAASAKATTATPARTPAPPVITTQPASVTAAPGATANFTVAATGNPAPAYNWQWGGNGRWLDIANTNMISDVSSATTATLKVDASKYVNGYQWRCVLTNSAGTVTSNPATLTIAGMSLSPVTAATATLISSSTTATAVTYTFAGKFTTTGPATIEYKWFHSEPNNPTQIKTIKIPAAGTHSIDNDTWTVPRNPQPRRVGARFSFDPAPVNMVVSNLLDLTVPGLPASPPVITAQPADANIAAGANTLFEITATGNPAPAYNWQRSINGGAWENLANLSNDIRGATTDTLSITSIPATFNGSKYRCIVTNSVGTATSNPATLTVAPPATKPVITNQPPNLNVTEGQPATFSIIATGAPAPAYTWQVSKDTGKTWTNTTSLGNYPPTLTVSEKVTTQFNGYQYRCIVTNSAGSVTSNPATLTVKASTTSATATSTSTPAASTPKPASGTSTMQFAYSSSYDKALWIGGMLTNPIPPLNAVIDTVRNTTGKAFGYTPDHTYAIRVGYPKYPSTAQQTFALLGPVPNGQPNGAPVRLNGGASTDVFRGQSCSGGMTNLCIFGEMTPSPVVFPELEITWHVP